MKNTLVVFVQGDTWMADYSNTPESDDLKKLFGTDVLSTAFSPVHPVSQVIEELTAWNPAYAVVERKDVR